MVFVQQYNCRLQSQNITYKQTHKRHPIPDPYGSREFLNENGFVLMNFVLRQARVIENNQL